MSLKLEIETWVQAITFYDNNEFDESLNAFAAIADTSKIHFNCGVIYATLGEHEKAVQAYVEALKLDRYLAVANFQQGVSNFLMGDFEEALANFDDALRNLRGNKFINYEQLGLKFRLYLCEVMFNRGLCYIYLKQTQQGMQDLTYAAQEKAVPDHDVIEEAIRERAEGYTVFSIPVGVVYRPNEAKVKNLRAKDYLGKAKLVATADKSNAYTGFMGPEIKRMNSLSQARNEKSDGGMSHTASNLVKSDLRSRNRQQSEPPLNRAMFPPTPPPDNDRHSNMHSNLSPGPLSARSDVTNRSTKPRPLDLSGLSNDRTFRSAKQPTDKSPQRSGRSRTRSQTERPRISPPGLQKKASFSSTTKSPSERVDTGDYNFGKSNAGMAKSTYSFISEEDDETLTQYDEPEFEMMSVRSSTGRSRIGAPMINVAPPPPPEIKKIRVKVHSDDTRYVMISTEATFKEFSEQIKKKFGLTGQYKLRIQDEGDMVTMADQDDLEMAISQCKIDARKDRHEMGKMEVWLQVL